MAFWQDKSLQEMTINEWESLCDHCGMCCLHKLEDEDSGEIAFTNVACQYYDFDQRRCGCYAERSIKVPDCLDLKKQDFSGFLWMPKTCAYRLLSTGQPLPPWHPLVSGNPQSVTKAGKSIVGYAIKETDVDDLEDHIIAWL